MTPAKPRLCPSCFAKEIDPVFLKQDRESHTYYCLKCGYEGSSRDVVEFNYQLQKARYRVEFRSSPQAHP